MEISVLLPAYNAERFILSSIQSVLAQTFERFELLVVDDCSADRTAEILASIEDPRLRVIRNERNLGIVGSLNRAMSEARGRYIARIDADDFCTPTRFAHQKRFLDANPQAVMVATEMSVLSGGQVRFTRTRASADPLVLRWMLHIDNPVGHPSMMFRADAVQKLGQYLSEEMRYAEDFDFSHRMLALGDIAVLPSYLTIYRQHESNLTRLHRETVVERAARVLDRVYSELLGRGAAAEADLIARHLFSGSLVETDAEWDRLRATLDLLRLRFAERHALSGERQAMADRFTANAWTRVVNRSLENGAFRGSLRAWRHPPSGVQRPLLTETATPAAMGVLHALRPVARALRRVTALPKLKDGPHPFEVDGTRFVQALKEDEGPPRLYVVVDTEAEFNWRAPTDREETRVTSAAHQQLAQDIFDQHGVRPIYVVDYSIASQPQGYEPLLAILERHGCFIGAHLHPWTTPPFEEEVSERNTFAGNLPPGLEERKLRTLVGAIRKNFGVQPLFFKAGRYGLSGQTLEILERLGFQVDFSVLPLTDLRELGGPDFRKAGAHPYRIAGGSVTSIPMMRGQAGWLAPLPVSLHGAINSRLARRLRLPGILARANLVNTATLTPEGMTVAEQIGLIRTMAARGHRTFVLHYHSPSLGGHTPYVRNNTELQAFLANIEQVCCFFLGPFGGLAGNPQDLLPWVRRNDAWPERRAHQACSAQLPDGAKASAPFETLR